MTIPVGEDFLLSLRAPFLDRLDRKEQMQVIVRERNEAVPGVEIPGVGIDGQDFDRKQAELFGQLQAATQGVAQECLPKPLTPGFLIDGQPPKQDDRDGVLGQPLGGLWGKVCDGDGAGRKRVIASHRRCARKQSYISPSQPTLFILAHPQTQKVIQGRLPTGKLSAFMGSAQRFDTPFSHVALTCELFLGDFGAGLPQPVIHPYREPLSIPTPV